MGQASGLAPLFKDGDGGTSCRPRSPTDSTVHPGEIDISNRASNRRFPTRQRVVVCCRTHRTRRLRFDEERFPSEDQGLKPEAGYRDEKDHQTQ